MVIHGVGYRGVAYTPTSSWARLWPIAAHEYRALFRRRVGVLVFIACMLPAIANLGILLVQTGVWQLGIGREGMRSMPRMDPATLDFYLVPTIGEVFSFVVFLVLSSLVSCRSVAKDRESQALEIYWTRGIGPRGYFVAKWLGSFLLVGTAFVAAPLVTWLVGVLLASEQNLFAQTIGFMPAVALALVLFTAVLTLVAVGFSALASNANIASLLWFVTLLGSTALVRVLSRMFPGEYAFKAISPWDATKRLAEWICGYTPREDYAPGYALASLAVLLALLALLVLRRLRRTEAIG